MTEIDHLGKESSVAANVTLNIHFQVSKEKLLGSQSSHSFHNKIVLFVNAFLCS